MIRAEKRPSNAVPPDPSDEPGKFSEVEMTYQEIADRFGVSVRAVTMSHDNAMAKLWKLAEDADFKALLEGCCE